MRKLIKKIFGKKHKGFFIDVLPVELNQCASVGKKYTKYVIPVGGLSRKEAEKKIGRLITDYNEEIDWENGDIHIPTTKDFWLPIKNKSNN